MVYGYMVYGIEFKKSTFLFRLYHSYSLTLSALFGQARGGADVQEALPDNEALPRVLLESVQAHLRLRRQHLLQLLSYEGQELRVSIVTLHSSILCFWSSHSHVDSLLYSCQGLKYRIQGGGPISNEQFLNILFGEGKYCLSYLGYQTPLESPVRVS